VGCFLTPSSPRGSTVIRAVDVATVAAVTDVEDGTADPASLADDVNNWTVADRRATSIFRLCCVWMTQTTARGPVDAGPLPFLPSSSPTEPPTARFRPGPSIRFGFQPPSTARQGGERCARFARADRRREGGERDVGARNKSYTEMQVGRRDRPLRTTCTRPRGPPRCKPDTAHLARSRRCWRHSSRRGASPRPTSGRQHDRTRALRRSRASCRRRMQALAEAFHLERSAERP
jgi:hypothetical protein